MAIRSAAIIGPTPETLYWALEQPCALKTPDRRGVCPGAFRQLRSLQALSDARRDGRVQDGVAWHPDAAEQAPSDLLGFPVDEVVRAYGGRQRIEAACGVCPANVERDQGGWGVCFGMIPFWPSGDPSLTAIQQTCDSLAASETGRRLWQQLAGDGEDAQPEGPLWYRLWCHPMLQGSRLQAVAQMMTMIYESLSSIPMAEARTAWARGCRGLQWAERNGLRLFLEYLPAGHSDGVTWTLPAHCGHCKTPRESAGSRCPRCAVRGNWESARRRKVLGLRPYLKLADVLGLERTENLWRHIRAS